MLVADSHDVIYAISSIEFLTRGSEAGSAGSLNYLTLPHTTSHYLTLSHTAQTAVVPYRLTRGSYISKHPPRSVYLASVKHNIVNAIRSEISKRGQSVPKVLRQYYLNVQFWFYTTLHINYSVPFPFSCLGEKHL